MPNSNPIVVALCNVMQSHYQTKVAGFTLTLDEQTIICFRILPKDMSNDYIYVEEEYITSFARRGAKYNLIDQLFSLKLR